MSEYHELLFGNNGRVRHKLKSYKHDECIAAEIESIPKTCNREPSLNNDGSENNKEEEDNSDRNSNNDDFEIFESNKYLDLNWPGLERRSMHR
jgi:hypothetical protein